VEADFDVLRHYNVKMPPNKACSRREARLKRALAASRRSVLGIDEFQ